MADANLSRLSGALEAEFGTVPDAGFKTLAYASGSLAAGNQVIRSALKRGDRQAAASVRVGRDSQCSINTEWIYGLFDDYIPSVLGAEDWQTEVDISADTISAEAEDTTSGSEHPNRYKGANGAFADIQAGDWVLVGGFTTEGNNGLVKVTGVTNPADAANYIEVAKTLTDEAAGDTVTIKGQTVRNGLGNNRSHSIQEEQRDLKDVNQVLPGARVSALSLDSPSRQQMTGTIEFVGRNVVEVDDAGLKPVAAPQDGDVMAEVDAFKGLYVNYEKVKWDLYEWGWNATSPARTRPIQGEFEARNVLQGTFGVEGRVNVYLGENAKVARTRFLSFTKFPMAFTVEDLAGNMYVFDFPRVSLNTEPGNLGAQDEDRYLDITFGAEPGPPAAGKADKTMLVTRISA